MVCFYADGKAQTYEIFAAVKTGLSGNDPDAFPYYRYDGELFPEEHAALCGWLTGHSEYDAGIAPESMEPLLLLSTCSYHTKDGRLVVAARKK